jgi:16S rRNA (uracil1498-N3)-methyltransferase
MQRYFIEKLDIENKKAFLKGDDFHHISHVMRFKIGSMIIICDSEVCYQCEITSYEKDMVVVDLKSEMKKFKTFHCDIAQALIRRERFEFMIQKSSELGVHTIIPTIMRHSIIKVDPSKTSDKVKRWEKIAKEASEQSHRFVKANVTDVCELKDIDYDSYELVLVAYEKEKDSVKLKEVLSNTYQKILVVIGPEGGFHESEIAFLSSLENVKLVGLGPRILRSETASSYILSVLSYVYEYE